MAAGAGQDEGCDVSGKRSKDEPLALAGRAGLIIGGQGRAGAAMALRLAAAGATLALAGPDGSARPELIQDVRAYDANAAVFAIDGIDEAAWRGLADTLAAQFAPLDFLIHIPKPGIVKTIDAMTLAEFRQAQHDIQHATFLAVRLGTEAIRRGGRGGSIVCVSGAAWRISGAGLGAVSSGDGGVRLMTKSAALELGAERIRVNALQLAPTATEDDAAAAALFLVSDRSRFMTGAELLIDGGAMAGC